MSSRWLWGSAVSVVSGGIFLLTACASAPASALPPLRLAATDLAAPLLYDLVSGYSVVHPDIAVMTSIVSVKQMDADLAAGRVDIGLAFSHPLTYFATPLGCVEFVIVGSPATALPHLSAAQVRALFSGEITDWAQVGGAPGAVQVVSRPAGTDAALAFESEALGGVAVTGNALVAWDWEAMRYLVGQYVGAIGYLPPVELGSEVQLVYTEERWPTMIVALTHAEPQGAARDFLLWAQTPEGQNWVARQARPWPCDQKVSQGVR